MKDYFFEPLLYTFVRVIGSLLPFLFLAIVVFADVGDYPPKTALIGKGELLIICISLALGAIYSFLSSGYKVGHNLILITTVLLIFGSIIGGVSLYTSELKDVYYKEIDSANSQSELVTQEKETSVTETKEGEKEASTNDTAKKTPAELGKQRVAKISILFLMFVLVVVFLSRVLENHEPSTNRSAQQSSFQKKVEANG